MESGGNKRLAKNVLDAVEGLNNAIRAAINGNWQVEIEIPDNLDIHRMRNDRLIQVVQLAARVSWPIRADDPVE